MTSFQVLIDTATRGIVGVGVNSDGTFDPGTDPGPGYAIDTLHDDALLGVILEAPAGAMLGADGQSVTIDRGTFSARPPEQLDAERAAVQPAQAQPDPGSW